jgi:hypothetical protein
MQFFGGLGVGSWFSRQGTPLQNTDSVAVAMDWRT